MSMKKQVNNEYIKSLTDSLSSGIPSGSRSAPGTAAASQDQSSVASTIETSNTLLYRYGQDTSTAKNKILPNSIQPLGRKNPNNSSASVMSENTTDTFIQNLKQNGGNYPTEMDYDAHVQENQAHVNFLINMERNKNKGQKLVSGAQFRIPMKQHDNCGNCEAFNQTNKKLKEVIRTLKLQIARMEENLHQVRMNKTHENNALFSSSLNAKKSESTRSSLDYSAISREDENKFDIEALKLRSHHFEEELVKTKKILAFERTTNESVRKSADDNKNTLNLELLDVKNSLFLLTNEHTILRESHRTQEKQIETLNTSLLNYKQQLEKSENSLSDAKNRLKTITQSSTAPDMDALKEIARLKAELSESELNNTTLQNSIKSFQNTISSTENKLKTANLSITNLNEKLETSSVELKNSQGELKISQIAGEKDKKRCLVLEDTLKIALQETQGVKNTLNLREADLTLASQKIQLLEQELANYRNKNGDLMKRMSTDSENTKKALEKAISASVRLCVVAPTVNVHVADKKLKFKAGLSEDALKQFLTSEVLDKYSFLFKQKVDNSAPNGQDLEPWLQKMLSHMQTSIEQHVSSAMDGSSL